MQQYRLSETTPASCFGDAHLLGNGSLGVSVFGGVPYEKLLINHDTLWTGQERNKAYPGTQRYMEKARKLILAGKLKEANNLVNDEMLGNWSESFEPLGYLHLTIGQTDDWRSMKLRKLLSNDVPVSQYQRTLSLHNAVETIEYDQGGVHYKREYFSSFPDQVVAMRLSVEGGRLHFALAMDAPIRHEEIVLPDGMAITGRAPDRVEPYGPITEPYTAYLEDDVSDSIRFAASARIVETDGRLLTSPFRMYVEDASYAVILLSASTNYAGYQQKRNKDPNAILTTCQKTIDMALQKGYDALKRRHVEDYSALYNRVDVAIGEPVADHMPTSQRLSMLPGTIDDPSFSGLVLQYARYLTIAGSRPGSQALNLQGIWNPEVVPPWASNYTTNINVQMNYWSTEILGLAECHLPLMDLVKELAHSGQSAARELYGMDGWVAHHNTDLFRMATIAGDDAAWCWWPFGGIWLCQHLWEHYLFSLDQKFLGDVIYPIFKGAVAFLLDFLFEDEEGHLVTAPSTSPENKFILPGFDFRDEVANITAQNRFSPNQAQICAVSKASTADLTMTREIFLHFKETVETLGMDDGFLPRIQDAMEKLHPFKIGKHGQLQEWEQDFEECTPGMGHMSHLYGVYPAAVITRNGSVDLFAAAEKSFLRRVMHGGLKNGWPGSWALALAARFGQNMVCALTNNSIAERLSANLLTKGHMQIDSIFGWAAGIAEMLIQSHDGCIELLPTLAPMWQKGFIKGIRARGGLEVYMKWDRYQLESAEFMAISSGTYVIRYRENTIEVNLSAGQFLRVDGDLKVL